jgi:hypothetical protein
VFAKNDIFEVKNSQFTKWRDAIQFRGRYEHLDSIELRQQLGEISRDEVKECQKVFGSSQIFYRANNEPAKIVALPTISTLFYFGSGLGLGAYGKFVRGYSFLWLIAGVLPAMTHMAVVKRNQPETTL